MSTNPCPDEFFDVLTTRQPAPTGAVLRPSPNGIFSIRGPDAPDFLHHICTQDVATRVLGELVPAAFLTSKGKLSARAWLARGADGFWIEVAQSGLHALVELCERYHFSERLEIAVPEAWSSLEKVTVTPAPVTPDYRFTAGASGVLHLVSQRGRKISERIHGPRAVVAGLGADLPDLDPALAECLRIASGEPLVDVDTGERTLVLEAGLDDHVSATKGCYVGQEIVARVHTYGHVNRRLVRLGIATTAPIAPDTTLVEASLGDAVGRVTSSARVPGGEWTVALGFLAEAFLREPEPLHLATRDGPLVRHADLSPA